MADATGTLLRQLAERIASAADEVAHGAWCCGTHDGDLIGNAFSSFADAIRAAVPDGE